MPIKAKVVPIERKRLEAQGRLGSAGSARAQHAPSKVAEVDENSDTSSDSDASSAASPAKNTKATDRSLFVDPTEDFAAYSKRMAKQEWLYATGQSGGVPTPPPKPAAGTAQAQSPAVRRQQPTSPTPPVQNKSAPAAIPKSEVEEKHQERAPPAQEVHRPERSQQPALKKDTANPVTNVRASPVRPAPAPAVVVATPETQPASEVTVVEPKEPILVTDEQEAANPGRRDFLKLLDLLGDEAEQQKKNQREASERLPANAAAAEAARIAEEAQRELERQEKAQRKAETAGMNLNQLTEYYFDKLYKAWVDSEADATFIALEEWQKAEAMAMLDLSEGIDPGELHQAMRQVRMQPEESSSMLQRSLRYNAAVQRLEVYVLSNGFVDRVNQFLHKYHQVFLKSKPSRERGEHQHEDHAIWQRYCRLMEQLVVGDLKRHVDGFDEEEFFDSLFDAEKKATNSNSDNSGSPRNDDDTAAGGARSFIGGLSLEVWEILLSFLRFEHFCELMDEYIAVHYNVKAETGSSGVTGIIGALRRSPPPMQPRQAAPSSGSVSGSADSGSQRRSSAATTSTTSTASTSTTTAAKPRGGIAVGPRPVSKSSNK